MVPIALVRAVAMNGRAPDSRVRLISGETRMGAAEEEEEDGYGMTRSVLSHHSPRSVVSWNIS